MYNFVDKRRFVLNEVLIRKKNFDLVDYEKYNFGKKFIIF